MKAKPTLKVHNESRLQSLKGIVKNDDGFDYKKQLAAIKKKRFDSI